MTQPIKQSVPGLATGTNKISLEDLPLADLISFLEVQSPRLSYKTLTGTPTIPAATHVEGFSGTTDASGNITFTFATAFTAVPVVTTGSKDIDISVAITALSATSVTLQTRQSTNPIASRNVQCIAVEAS